MNTKKKNPLYVVTNKGKDVEEAVGFFDALVKRLGLEGGVMLLEGLIQDLLRQVTNYGTFLAVKNFIDTLLEKIEALIKKIDPILSFGIYNR